MKNKDEILRKFDEAIQYFINCSENLPGTEFSNNVDKLINVKCGIVNGVETSHDKALHKHFVNASFLPECTRVEVIDQSGRAYVNWKSTNKVQTQMQDDNKTLKVFIT